MKVRVIVPPLLHPGTGEGIQAYLGTKRWREVPKSTSHELCQVIKKTGHSDAFSTWPQAPSTLFLRQLAALDTY